MKKLLAGILVLAIVFCFAGCSNDETNVESDPIVQQSQTIDTSSNGNSINNNTTQPMNNAVSTCVECGRECESGHSYCSSCGCWESGCLLPQKDMSVYCVNHSCLLCTSARSYNSPYCSRHKCSSCENVVVDGSDYCVAHKCLMCDRKVFGNSQYCGTHK